MIKYVNVNVKIIVKILKNYSYLLHRIIKDYSFNSSTCIYENSKYLKSVVADTSVTMRDKILIVMNNLSTKKA